MFQCCFRELHVSIIHFVLIFRWTRPIGNASFVSNARATVVTGLSTASTTKTARILSVTNNNNVTNTSTNNQRSNTNSNNSGVLEAKLDPSDSIIMAVDPLERSFNNMHETVPPAQLGKLYFMLVQELPRPICT